VASPHAGIVRGARVHASHSEAVNSSSSSPTARERRLQQLM
jgi:hypothetical protein